VGRVEVFKNGQTFLEVRDDRRLDDFARRLGHQAAHTGKLLHLRWRTTRARVAHHVDRVDLRHAAGFRIDRLCTNFVHHGVRHLIAATAPGIDDLVVLFLLRDQAVLVLLLVIGDQFLGLGDEGDLAVRNDHVVLAERDAGLESVAEAKAHDGVGEQHRVLLTGVTIDLIDHVTDFLLRQKAVDDVEGHLVRLGQTLGKQHAARRGAEPHHVLLTLLVGLRHAGLDLRVERHGTDVQRLVHFGHVGELHAFARLTVAVERQVIEAQHHVLRRHDDRLAVGRRQDVVGRHHQHARFKLGFQRKRHVDGHLVTVEVGVEGRADQRVKLDRLALDQHGLERLDAQTVKRRRAVEHDRVLANDFVEDVPDFLAFLLNPLLGLLQGHRQTLGIETRVDERLEQLERHLLGQTTLVQLEFRSGHDDRTARVVDALAEQVLAEAALLALEHVGQRLQRTLVGARDDAATAAVVEQGVNGFLQHALFVADDDVRRAQFDQALQAVVAVDHAAIEIVEIGRREAAAVQRHQRAQFRRNDRNDFQDHPFRAVARIDERFDDLQPLDDLLGLEFRLGRLKLVQQIGTLLLEIERDEHVLHGFRADAGRERILAVLVLRVEHLVLGEKLVLLHRGQARLDDDVALEVEDALKLLELHVEQQADA